MAFDDLTGRTFGSLFVLYVDSRDMHGGIRWLCLCECGNTTIKHAQNLRSGKATRCKECRYRGWNRGGHRTVNGYRVMYAKGHPNAAANGQIMVHVLVMSEMLDRPLLPGETVHHRNGVKDDNRPENLELWVSHQPSGQRPEDLLVWAQEIIERYGNDATDLSS